MIQRMTIPGRLPGLNEYTRACRAHPMAGAKMKREAQDAVLWCARAARLRPHGGPVRVRDQFFEAPARKGARLRDKSNIASFAVKVIEDALVEAGLIPDDGWDEVAGYSCEFARTADPRIVVTIEDGLA